MKLSDNLNVQSIRFSPSSPSIRQFGVSIQRKALFVFPLLLFQMLLLCILFCTAFLGARTLFTSRPGIQIGTERSLHPLRLTIISLIGIFFLYILSHPKTFWGHYGLIKPSFHFLGNILLFNLFLAASFIILYYLVTTRITGKSMPLLLVVPLSMPIALTQIPFTMKTSADSLLWMLNLLSRSPEISFSEFLSLTLNKALLTFYNLFFEVSEKQSIILTGKLMGIFIILSLLILINTFDQFSLKKKTLTFLLFSSMSFNILPFGFPEFRYYSVPFLLLFLAVSRKYLAETGENPGHLFTAAFLITIAGLFHGLAYFSFPTVLILPVLKHRLTKKSGSYCKQYGLILLSVISSFLILLIICKLFHFSILLHTARGGFDGKQFISLLPQNIHFPNAVVFLEPRYFLTRGWIFLISGSFVFLLYLNRWRKPLAAHSSDSVLALLALSQLFIIMFWNFDLGIFDFDLYIVPTSLVNLFLIQSLVESLGPDPPAWKYILSFSGFSMIYPLMRMMTIGNTW